MLHKRFEKAHRRTGKPAPPPLEEKEVELIAGEQEAEDKKGRRSSPHAQGGKPVPEGVGVGRVNLNLLLLKLLYVVNLLLV